MADGIFDFVAAQLEEHTPLERLEARGTVRIALKEAGLDPKSVTTAQMMVMLRRTMPVELDARGVDRAVDVCERLASRVEADAGSWASDVGDSPEDVFRRLGGR